MTAVLNSKTRALPPSPPHVSWSDGVVELRDERVFGTGGDALASRFLAQAFGVEGIVSITIDRSRATASIRHEEIPGGRAGLLERLAVALRQREESVGVPRYVRGVVKGSTTEYLRGSILPACEILFDGPGRLRLRLGAIRNKPELAQRLERLLGTVPGVRNVSTGVWFGRLLVQYEPARLNRDRLFSLIGETLYGPDVWTRSLPEPPAVKFGLANTTLGVAALGTFVAPVLLPVSAVLLLTTNWPNLKVAWQQVRAKRCGLPVLYTAIVGTTLATGGFIASSSMSWLFCYWNRRYRRDLATERHRLLDSCLPLPGSVRLLSSVGTEVLVEAEQVRPGDRLIISAGEAIAADGRVIRGEGVVDERSLRGTDGASRKRTGDRVLAGAFVLSGDLVIEVECVVENTRAAKVGRALVFATSPAPGQTSPTRKAEAFAERAVGPTLATAGFGLLVGDLNSVGAILRPDYATGTGLGDSLNALRDVAACARCGVLVRDPSVFARLARVDLVVLDDVAPLHHVGLDVAKVVTRVDESDILRYAASAFRHLDDPRSPALLAACREGNVHLLDLPPVDLRNGVTLQHGARRVSVREQTHGRHGDTSLVVEVNGTSAGVVSFRRGTRPDAAGVVKRLREEAEGRLSIAMVTERPGADIAAFAAALGVNQLRGGLGPEGKAAFLKECRERGVNAAFVGDCRRNSEASNAAYASIDLVGDGPLDLEQTGTSADVTLLGERLDRLERLWDAARTNAGKSVLDHAFVVAPNLFCVAGAFLFGFTGLTAVAISNLGTLGAYARASGDLRAQGLADRRRFTLPRESLAGSKGPKS